MHEHGGPMHQPAAGEAPARAALVLGGATCVWKDLDRARALHTFNGVIACNDAGAFYPDALDAWVSLHPLKWPEWLLSRALMGHPDVPNIISHRQEPGVTQVVDYRFNGVTPTGSSGLYAAKVALALGFNRVVLCGVPMDPQQAHFFDGKPWDAAPRFKAGWRAALPYIAQHVRSMSGWTAELLGRPSAEWLSGL